MLQFLKSSFWSFCSILVRAVSVLGINKLLALYYGPNGITLYAHFQNLVAILTAVPDGGINIGMVKFLANHKAASPHYSRYFVAGAFLNLLCVLGALGIVFSFTDYYFDTFWQELTRNQSWWWLLCFGLGGLLVSLNLFLLTVLLAKRMLPQYVLGTSALSVAALAFVAATRGQWSLNALLLGMLLAQAALFFLFLPLLYLKDLLPSFREVKIPKRIYSNIGKYILMALSAVVCMKLTSFFVRDYMISRFGTYDTGLWQAVVRVSDNYSMVYTSFLGMLYYPRMAALAPDQEALRRFVRQTFYLVFPGLAIALLLVYLLRHWILVLLFNEDFLAAESLFGFQLLGDFFKMWSVLLTYLLLVQAHARIYIVWNIGSALLYMGLVYVLVKAYGLEGVTMAHCLCYGLVLLFSVVYYNRYIRL